MSAALARAEAELRDLRAELSRNAQMASRLNEAEAEVRVARGEVARSKEEAAAALEASRKEVADARSEATSARAEAEAAKQEAADARGEAAAARTAAEAARKEVEDAESGAATARAAEGAARQEVIRKDLALVEAGRLIEDLRSEKLLTLAEKRRLEQRAEGLTSNLAALGQHCDGEAYTLFLFGSRSFLLRRRLTLPCLLRRGREDG